MTDRELIGRVLAHGPGAADHFVTRFSRFVWSILVRDFRIPPERAENIYQDLFVRLWDDDYRRLRMWRGEGAFASYLGPVVRNLALDHLRADPLKTPGRSDRDDDQPVFDPFDREPSPEELAMVQQQREKLERAVERLSARDRALYDLRHEQDLSYIEIAAALGLSVNAVGVALTRLTQRLRALVEERAPDPADRRTDPAAGVRSPEPGPSG